MISHLSNSSNYQLPIALQHICASQKTVLIISSTTPAISIEKHLFSFKLTHNSTPRRTRSNDHNQSRENSQAHHSTSQIIYLTTQCILNYTFTTYSRTKTFNHHNTNHYVFLLLNIFSTLFSDFNHFPN